MTDIPPTETLEMQLKMLRLQADMLHKRLAEMTNEVNKMRGQITRLSIMIDEVTAASSK